MSLFDGIVPPGDQKGGSERRYANLRSQLSRGIMIVFVDYPTFLHPGKADFSPQFFLPKPARQQGRYIQLDRFDVADARAWACHACGLSSPCHNRTSITEPSTNLYTMKTNVEFLRKKAIRNQIDR